MENLIFYTPFLPIFFTVYGLLQKERIFFLTGYALFGFLIIISECFFYSQNNNSYHLLVAGLFLLQLIFSYPSSIQYDGSNVSKSLNQKLCFLLVLTNIVGVFVVSNNPLINNIRIFYHFFFVISAAVYCYLIRTNKLILFKK